MGAEATIKKRADVCNTANDKPITSNKIFNQFPVEMGENIKTRISIANCCSFNKTLEISVQVGNNALPFSAGRRSPRW